MGMELKKVYVLLSYCVFLACGMHHLAPQVDAAVTTGDDEPCNIATDCDPNDDPQDDPQCHMRPYCDFLEVEVPLGGGAAEVSFALSYAGILGTAPSCLPGERCLCNVEVRVEGRVDPLYRGELLGDSFQVPAAALPRSKNGEYTFYVHGQTTTDGSCPSFSTNFDEEDDALCALRVRVGETHAGDTLTPPSEPQQILASPLNSSEVELLWTLSAGAEGYRVLRKTAGSNWQRVADLESGTQRFIDRGTPGTTYEYQVVGYNSGGASLPSAIASVRLPRELDAGGGLLAPRDVSVAAYGSGFEVLWRDESAYEQNYLVERKIGSFGSYQTIATLAANTSRYVDTNLRLIDGQYYYYRIVALRGSLRSISEETEYSFGFYYAPRYTDLPLGCERFDVDTDGFVTLNDSLIITSDLRSGGARPVPAGYPNDVNGDQLLTLTDSLEVVSVLRNVSCERSLIEQDTATHMPTPDPEPTPAFAEHLFPRPQIVSVSRQLYEDLNIFEVYGMGLQLQRPGSVSYEQRVPTGQYRVEVLQLRRLAPWSAPQPVGGYAGTLGQHPTREVNGFVSFDTTVFTGNVWRYFGSDVLGDIKKLSFSVKVSQYWEKPGVPGSGVWITASKAIPVDFNAGVVQQPYHCGNNVLEPGESCDHGVDNGHPLNSFCLPNCRIKDLTCYDYPASPECLGLERFYQVLPESNSETMLTGLVAEGEAPVLAAPLPWQSGGTAIEGTELAQESVYGSMRVANIDGDTAGREDFCMRRSDGIWCSLSGESSVEAARHWSSAFGNTQGFENNASQWGTISLVELNGDRKADICARYADGIRCALSNGAAFGSPTLWSSYFSDANGWGVLERAKSIGFANVDGDAGQVTEVCGHNAQGVFCGFSSGSKFGSLRRMLGQYYWADQIPVASLDSSSIQYPELHGDGRADVCGLAPDGEVYCARSYGTLFYRLQRWTTGLQAQSAEGLQFPDINGDGRDDICLRRDHGLFCGLSTGVSFSALQPWSSEFGSEAPWSGTEPLFFRDFNGDALADVCARRSDGVYCAQSNGTAFIGFRLALDRLLAAAGWDAHPAFAAGIRFAEINGDGRADLCAMSVSGLLCAQNTSSDTQLLFTPRE